MKLEDLPIPTEEEKKELTLEDLPDPSSISISSEELEPSMERGRKAAQLREGLERAVDRKRQALGGSNLQKTGDFLKGVASGALAEWDDEAVASAMALRDIASSRSLDMQDYNTLYRKYLPDAREAKQDARTRNAILSGLGEFAGTFISPAGKGRAAVRATQSGKIRQGVKAGSLASAIQEAGMIEGDLDTVEGVARTLGAGVAGGLLGAGFANLATPSPDLTKAEKTLARDVEGFTKLTDAQVNRIRKNGVDTEAVMLAIANKKRLPKAYSDTNKIMNNIEKVKKARQEEYGRIVDSIDDEIKADIPEMLDASFNEVMSDKLLGMKGKDSAIRNLKDLRDNLKTYMKKEKLDPTKFDTVPKLKKFINEEIKNWDVDAMGLDKKAIYQEFSRSFQNKMDTAVAYAAESGELKKALADQFIRNKAIYGREKTADRILERTIQNIRAKGIKPLSLYQSTKAYINRIPMVGIGQESREAQRKLGRFRDEQASIASQMRKIEKKRKAPVGRKTLQTLNIIENLTGRKEEE